MGRAIGVAPPARTAATLASGLIVAWAQAARAQNIIEQWDSLKARPAGFKPVVRADGMPSDRAFSGAVRDLANCRRIAVEPCAVPTRTDLLEF